MATFIGYNSINQHKKFTLVDFDLIKRDLINALNIQQGEVPGRPDYGTVVWSYLFENQTPTLVEMVTAEIQRVAAGDPRIFLNDTQVFQQENGMLIQLLVSVVNGSTAEQLAIFFDQNTRRATYV